ncbi:hypothetical protein INR49_002077 [Caranx melampygus]|nr:hypothetical protein INR49_002077 [Caranx melampygus]
MSKIEIRNVNTSDEGYYYLRDRKDRLVSVTKMDLTDKHDTVEGNPLMALLLLLGIPAGICCCCRKKIFKKQKASTTATLQTSPGEVVHTPPVVLLVPALLTILLDSQGRPDPSMGPSVHPPPPATGPAPWNGPPPSPGFNPAYPPQNPAYPPAGPAMVPPAGPQWNGPPPGQYPPGPGAPMGYAPVMYSSPPPAAGEPVKEEIKMENMAPSSADPLLNATPEAAAPSASGPPTSTSYQYNVDGASAPNFL